MNLEVPVLVHEMTPEQCRETLARSVFGRLACSHDNQPYVVPVHFVLDGEYVYSFSMEGRKIDWMRENPLVCLAVDAVKDSDDWTSVLVFGRFEELRESEEGARLHAYTLLRKRASWWEPGAAFVRRSDERRDADPIYYRIGIDHVTGRRAVPAAGSEHEERPRSAGQRRA